MLTTIIVSFLVAIVAGLITPYLFLRYQKSRGPRIEISPTISRCKNSKTNETVFKIKLLNRGRRDAINIQLRLDIVEVGVVQGGRIDRAHQIQIKSPTIFLLRRFDKKDENARHACRVTCAENLDQVWSKENTQLRIRILAEDSIWGTIRVFERIYDRKIVSIKDGEFDFGDTFDINP